MTTLLCHPVSHCRSRVNLNTCLVPLRFIGVPTRPLLNSCVFSPDGPNPVPLQFRLRHYRFTPPFSSFGPPANVTVRCAHRLHPVLDFVCLNVILLSLAAAPYLLHPSIQAPAVPKTSFEILAAHARRALVDETLNGGRVNAFLCFRSGYERDRTARVQGATALNACKISKEAGEHWWSLDSAEKDLWKAFAAQVTRERLKNCVALPVRGKKRKLVEGPGGRGLKKFKGKGKEVPRPNPPSPESSGGPPSHSEGSLPSTTSTSAPLPHDRRASFLLGYV